MSRVLASMAAALKGLVGSAELLSLADAARELKALYWSLRDATDFLHDTEMTARAHLLSKSLAAAADELNFPAATADELRACSKALSTWPELQEPFDGQVFEGPLTRETASVIALTSMRRAEEAMRAERPTPRPHPSGPVRLRPT
jgi:hypothetical protein